MSIAEVRCVGTGSYLVPAGVALSSFRRHNPWFRGRLVLCCAAEEAARAGRLLAGLDPVTIHIVDPALAGRASQLARFGLEPTRFWTLDLLRAPADGDVLLLDADVCVTGPLDELAAATGEVVACGEGAAHLGLAVDRVTNRFVEAPAPSAIARTFNSGVLRLAGELLGTDLLDRALATMAAVDWARLERPQHDQIVFNRLFEGRWNELDPSYNFLLRHAAAIGRRWGIGLADAKVIHFNVEPRPWQVELAERIADPVLAAATRTWLDAHAADIGRRALATATTATSATATARTTVQTDA